MKKILVCFYCKGPLLKAVPRHCSSPTCDVCLTCRKVRAGAESPT